MQPRQRPAAPAAPHRLAGTGRRRRFRFLALVIAGSLAAGCASADGTTAGTGAPDATTASSASDSTADGSTPGSTDPAASPTSVADPTSTTAAPLELPDVPVPAAPTALTGTPVEQAAAALDAMADPAAHDGAVLGAFAAARLPVIGTDGVSLTTPDDPVGLPWTVVWASTTAVEAGATTSLADLVGLLHLMDPAGALDAPTAAASLLDQLRALATTGDGSGPSFVAQVVAEDTRRAAGLELIDPAVTPDQVRIGALARTLLIGGALRAVYEGYVETGAIVPPVSSAGPSRVVHGAAAPTAVPLSDRRSEIDGLDGCDDGANGWWIWLASKFFAGAKPFPGLPLEWRGIYGALAQLGVDSGRLIPEVIEMTDGVGRFAGVAGALVNIALFATQLSDRHANVSMNGTGPLVRTKTTSNGEAREISIQLSYDDGHQEQGKVRNCILAALSIAGNNAQQALGDAANVEVEVTGGKGFADRLITAGSTVLFGPATYEPVQTASETGSVVVPVQGRAQRYEIPDDAPEVKTTFSVIVEASLDPVSASSIGRAFADDLLCLGNAAGGNTVDALAECQNAVIDILKQFHWDLGEYELPLVDWQPPGWYVDETLTAGDFPLQVAGSSCDSELGEWILTIVGSSGGMSVYSDLVVTFAEDGTGTGTLTWSGGGGGVSFESTASVQMELTKDGDGYLMHFVPGGYSTTVSGGGMSDVFANGGEGGVLHVHPAPEGMCG